jgi:hypothetical protein
MEQGTVHTCFAYGMRTVLILVDLHGTTDVDCCFDMQKLWHRGDFAGLASLACLQSFHMQALWLQQHVGKCIRGRKVLQRLKAIDDRSRLTACQLVQTLHDKHSAVIDLRPLFPYCHSNKTMFPVCGNTAREHSEQGETWACTIPVSENMTNWRALTAKILQTWR